MAASIHVLHVEDDADFASVTADFLESESEAIHVETATDSVAGVERARSGAVDCVVSDYDMPELDGIEVLERVRETHPERPFILFTGKGSEEVASEALSKGATDYLQKEVGTDQYAILANRIENAVRQRRSVAELERQDEILAEAQEIASLGVCEYDAAAGEWWFSEGMYREIGVPEAADPDTDGDADLDAILSLFHPAARDRIQAALGAVHQDGDACDLECRLATDGDAERWVRIRGKPQRPAGESRRIRATIQDVTDRREREQDLRQAERRFEAVFEDPHVLVGVLDADGTHRTSNELAMAYVDADRDDLDGVPFWETPWWDDVDESAVREWVERAGAGEYVTFEAETTSADGTPLHVEGSVRPVRDDDGTVTSLVISSRDVTGRSASEWERFYEALVAEANDVIAVVDEACELRYANPAVESVLGYEPEAVVGESVLDSIHPDDREAVRSWMDDHIASPESAAETIEYRARHADGGWAWLESRVQIPDGAAIDGYLVTSRDVTERTERERELQTLERVIEGLGRSLYILDPEGTYTYVNQAGASITGYDLEELLGSEPEMLLPAADVETFQRRIRELLQTDPDGVRTIETTLETKAGEEIPIEVTLTVQTDESGTFLGSVGVLTDITDRKQTERELREYESIIRALPDEVAILDTEGYVTRLIPPAGQELATSGYRPEEIEGEHVAEVMPEEYIERGAELIEELVTTDRDRVAYEIQILGTGGDRHWREDNLALLEGADGTIQGTVGVLRDIEERKAYERELERQNERLEEFASIASHDLRNPLNVAQGYMELLEDDCESEHADRVIEALSSMEQLIDATLTWARQGAMVAEREPIDFATLVPDCWEAVGNSDATIDLVDDVTVAGDPERVKRVIENLLRNAIEHGGEDVHVRIGPTEDGFYVEDDGPGIPPDRREDVLTAGFTTATEGTGFGLAIIAEIVEAHGWEIAVTESESGGARFEITGVDGI